MYCWPEKVATRLRFNTGIFPHKHLFLQIMLIASISHKTMWFELDHVSLANGLEIDSILAKGGLQDSGLRHRKLHSVHFKAYQLARIIPTTILCRSCSIWKSVLCALLIVSRLALLPQFNVAITFVWFLAQVPRPTPPRRRWIPPVKPWNAFQYLRRWHRAQAPKSWPTWIPRSTTRPPDSPPPLLSLTRPSTRHKYRGRRAWPRTGTSASCQTRSSAPSSATSRFPTSVERRVCVARSARTATTPVSWSVSTFRRTGTRSTTTLWKAWRPDAAGRTAGARAPWCRLSTWGGSAAATSCPRPRSTRSSTCAIWAPWPALTSAQLIASQITLWAGSSKRRRWFRI